MPPQPAPRAFVAVLAGLLLLAGCSATPSSAPAARAPAGAPSRTPTHAGDGRAWQPPIGTRWQWQLTGPLDLSVEAPVYDVDGQLTSAAQVADLHRRGRRAVCYVDVGSWEPGRPDAAGFASAVLGRPLDGFPDERWLDIRRLDLLAPLLQARFDDCRRKGFDAVEPDNVDGYANDSGFALTAEDQLRFDRSVAGWAHGRGLGVALKNDGEQVPALQPAFDFAVVEQCVQYDECSAYQPFVDAGKAVLEVEYTLPPNRFCPVTGPLRFSAMRKPLDLGPPREPCAES